MQKQQQKEQSHEGPEMIPSQVQLPGGIVLKGLPFKITEYSDGAPKLFELQPRNTESACVLFAREDLMRSAWPGGRPPQEPGPYKGPKVIPTKLQLRGGIVLKGLPFKIIGYDKEVPKLLELQPLGVALDIKQPHTCVLFAGEDLIRAVTQRTATRE